MLSKTWCVSRKVLAAPVRVVDLKDFSEMVESLFQSCRFTIFIC